MSSRLFRGRLRLTATTARNCTCTWKSTRGQTSDLKIPLLHFCTKTCMVINQHSNDQRTYCRHRSARAWSCEYLPCRGQAAWPHLRLGSTLTFKRGESEDCWKVKVTKSEFLLKSSGGCAGEAAEEEEDRQQWWSPVGWQVFYFAFSWQLILLFWWAFVLFVS